MIEWANIFMNHSERYNLKLETRIVGFLAAVAFGLNVIFPAAFSVGLPISIVLGGIAAVNIYQLKKKP